MFGEMKLGVEGDDRFLVVIVAYCKLRASPIFFHCLLLMILINIYQNILQESMNIRFTYKNPQICR